MRILVECSAKTYKGRPPKITDAWGGKTSAAWSFEELLKHVPWAKVYKDRSGEEWAYRCQVLEKGKGAGPTGRKIIGKIWGAFERLAFFCPSCRQYTIVYSSPPVPPLTPDKVENPALRRILFKEEP